jgi:hypothetical protein
MKLVLESSSMRLTAIFLVVQVALAQHSGGFARANPGIRGFSAPASSSRGPIVRAHRAFGHRFEGRSNSYLPAFGDYGLFGGYSYGNGYLYPEDYGQGSAPAPNVYFVAPPAEAPARNVEPTPAADAVIREYSFAREKGESEERARKFTIALRDGSQRSAVATWVQGGKLHYLDSEGRQQTLSADLIDRHETDRLNSEKHLQIQLPPG